MRRKNSRTRKNSRARKRRARCRRTVLLCSVSAGVLLCLLWIRAEKRYVSEKDRDLGKISSEDEGFQKTEHDRMDSETSYRNTIYPYTSHQDPNDIKQSMEVEKPEKRTKIEVLERLRQLGQDNSKIQKIYEEADTYPQEMLEALANNPEMTDFVSNYKGHKTDKGWRQKALTEEEKKQEYPLFIQWDERWGYTSYGDNSNIGLSGCGPTCLSMVLYYITRDARLTPDVLAEYAMEQGYYVSGTGTAWLFMEEGAGHFGISGKKLSKSEEVMKAELDRGHPIICAMSPGDFTAGGHFIVIYGYDEEGFFVNDPNCLYRSGKKWSYEQIAPQIKSIWSYR